ncbi:MAG: hypothetical protein Q7R95_05310 [bacterium]|nr:hypothetical protein [bacterium]
MKIPMQVYFDAETIEFYKQYARQQGKSFAALIREIVDEKKIIITKFPAKIKKIDKIKKNINNSSIMQAFTKAEKSLKNIEYHFENLTDDELLYKYAR